MKKSELKQLIKEQIKLVLKESLKYTTGDKLKVIDKNHKWFGKNVYVHQVNHQQKGPKYVYLVGLSKTGNSEAIGQSQVQINNQ